MDGIDINIVEVVRPAQVRLALSRTIHLVVVSATLAVALIALVQAAARTVTWPVLDPLGGPANWTLAIAAVALLALGVGIWRAWPAVPEVVHYTDRALDLKDRLTTAYQFQGQQSLMLHLQRADLAARLREVEVDRATGVRISFKDLGGLAAVSLVLVGALFLPNTQASAQRQRRNDQAVATRAAQELAQMEKTLQPLSAPQAKGAGSQDAAEKRAAQALRDAEAALARAQNKSDALKAISRARQQLQQLQSVGQSASSQLQRVAQALKQGPTSQVSQAITSGQASATQQALQTLAQNAPKLTSQQRASLVQSLERAANAADPSLSQSLRQAAFSVANNDSGTTSQALNTLGRSLAREQGKAASQQATAKDLSGLQQIRQQIAAGGSQPQQQVAQVATKPTAGKPSGSRPGPASGQQASTGTKQSGGGASVRQAAGARAKVAQASANQNGSGHASAPGWAGGGAQGGGVGKGQHNGGGSGSGQHGAGGSRAGHLETVYTTIREGSGPIAGQTGVPGANVPVQSAAFQQLIAHYQATSSTGEGRSTLPPDLQTDVHKYFKALGAG